WLDIGAAFVKNGTSPRKQKPFPQHFAASNSASQPASAAGRPPTRSSAGSRRAPGGTGTHGSRDIDSRPSWEGSKKDRVEMARLPARHPDPSADGTGSGATHHLDRPEGHEPVTAVAA
ncbi:unnamed protein product, partial [Gulo gulo]